MSQSIQAVGECEGARLRLGRVEMRRYAVSLASCIEQRRAKNIEQRKHLSPSAHSAKKTTLARFELTLPKEQDF